jgi:hypothetical protein
MRENRGRWVVDRTGCREPVCTCHDDAAWVPGVTYPGGCSACGCRWRPVEADEDEDEADAPTPRPTIH